MKISNEQRLCAKKFTVFWDNDEYYDAIHENFNLNAINSYGFFFYLKSDSFIKAFTHKKDVEIFDLK